MADANNTQSFAGRVAFVTGAANGIGRATALAFARAGASVAVADVAEQANQETARMIEAADGRALALKCDVSRAEDIKAALDKAVHTFGRLDFALNNAGIEQPIAATADFTEEQWAHQRQSSERLSVHEIRNPADAPARRWRDRQHVVGRRGHTRPGPSCIRSLEVRRGRTHEVGGA